MEGNGRRSSNKRGNGEQAARLGQERMEMELVCVGLGERMKGDLSHVVKCTVVLVTSGSNLMDG